MNRYQTIFIIDSGVESEDVEAIIEDVQNLITGSEGEIVKVDRWGKKRLAYEVKGNKDGNYVVVNFMADPQFIQRLGRYYSLTEQIIKYMTVRSEDSPEPEKEADEDTEFPSEKSGTGVDKKDDEDEGQSPTTKGRGLA